MTADRIINNIEPLLDEVTGEENRTTNQRGAPLRVEKRFNIPGDIVAKVCEDLPNEQRSALKWARDYCSNRNLSTDDFGAMLVQPGTDKTYSGDSVYQALTGRRKDGSLDRFCEAVHVLRRRVEEAQSKGATRFVQTDLARTIFSVCAKTFKQKRLTFLIADANPKGGDGTQIGKSRAVTEYTRLHNHGETILVRMPTGGSLHSFLSEMAVRLGISPGNSKTDIKRRIIESFDERTLLIVDEAENCVDERAKSYLTLDFIREIWDRRKCGIVIIGAINFASFLKSHYKLRKLWKRAGGRAIFLPTRPSKADLARFADAYGLDPAPDKTIAVNVDRFDYEAGEEITERVTANPLHLEEKVILEAGLGVWISLLEDAAEMAGENKKKITWGHVIAAHALAGEGL